MNKNEIYIAKYKELESVVRKAFNLSNEASIVTSIKSQKKYQKYSEKLRYCAEVRNFFQHNQKLGEGFPVVVSDDMIDFISKLTEEIKCRPKCKDIAIPFKKIYWVNLEDNVRKCINIMRENSYTHVPILKEKKVIGVFDENSLFSYLADEGIVDIDDELLFKDIKKYIKIKDREMEEFVFFDPNRYIDELELKIDRRFKEGKRIGVVFLTYEASEKSDLLGIITPWDLLSSK